MTTAGRRIVRPLIAAIAVAALLGACLAPLAVAQDQPAAEQPGPPPTETVAPATEPELPVAPAGPLPGQTRVAVVAFESPPAVDVDYQVGPGLADMLVTALVNQGRFWVIERAQMEKLLAEQDMGLQGVLELATAARASQVLGVQYLVMGKVTNFGFKGQEAAVGAVGGGLLGRLGGLHGSKRKAQVAIDVRMVDAATGRIVLSKKASGESSEGAALALGGDPQGMVGLLHVKSEEFENSMIGRSCRKAIDQLVKEVVDYFPFECRVSALAEGYAYLDAGKFQGLAPGRKLRVLREKPVTDSKGNVVFVETTEIGAVTIVEVSNDTAKAKIDSGAGSIQEGDKAMDPDQAGKGGAKQGPQG